MRMYKDIPWNTTRFQGIRKNTTRFQGIQENTQGTLSRTEWYANARRYLKEYNEIPRNTKATRFQGIQANTNGALNRTEWHANVQRDSKEYNENPRNTREHCVCSYWNAKEYQKTVCEQGMRTKYANKI